MSNAHQSSSDLGRKEEQEQVIVARYLSRIKSSPIFPYRIMPHQNYASSSSYHYHTYPTPSSGLFPFIQSIFRPEMSTLFVSRDDHQELVPLTPRTSSSPFFYLSENFLPVSHVRIEEKQQIQQVKTAITGRSITEATESRTSSAAAAPIRPNTNVSSTESRMFCASSSSHQMAPAVQIRSVIPVCSSFPPPVKRTSSSIQTLEGKRKSEEKQSMEENISAMNSEICRLKL